MSSRATKLLFEPQLDGLDDLRLSMSEYAKSLGLKDNAIRQVIKEANFELAFYNKLPTWEQEKALKEADKNLATTMNDPNFFKKGVNVLPRKKDIN